jgi:DNA-binding response OmpR family regulator
MATLTNLWESASVSRPASLPASQAHDTDDSGKDVVRAGDFRIDLKTRSATVCGQKLRLSCAEFDVLTFLISHRRRMVTAHTSLATKPEKSGPRRADFLPALLSLRKKLAEVVPGAHYIQTESWIVYDFHPGAARPLGH